MLEELIRIKHEEAIPVYIGGGKILCWKWEMYAKGDFTGTCWLRQFRGNEKIIILSKYNPLWVLRRVQVALWRLRFNLESIIGGQIE